MQELEFTLKEQKSGNKTTLYANNPLPLPVTVVLQVNAEGMEVVRGPTVIQPFTSNQLVLSCEPKPNCAWSFWYTSKHFMGVSTAKHDDYRYRLPFEHKSRCGQSFGGKFSHSTPDSFHSIDFLLDEGTPVLAARAGFVRATQGSYSTGGTDPSFKGKGNFVEVVHSDYSIARYVHFKHNGILVKVGDVVREGQPIGLAGNTGFSSASHLHMNICLPNGTEDWWNTIPFVFDDGSVQGLVPKEGEVYTAPQQQQPKSPRQNVAAVPAIQLNTPSSSSGSSSVSGVVQVSSPRGANSNKPSSTSAAPPPASSPRAAPPSSAPAPAATSPRAPAPSSAPVPTSPRNPPPQSTGPLRGSGNAVGSSQAASPLPSSSPRAAAAPIASSPSPSPYGYSATSTTTPIPSSSSPPPARAPSSSSAADDVYTERALDSGAELAHRQAKTFAKWINAQLDGSRRPVSPASLLDDLSDGTLLIELVYRMFKGRGIKLPKYNAQPKMRAQSLDNCVVLCNEMLPAIGVMPVFLKPQNIVDKDLNFVLGLIWRLILAKQIVVLSPDERTIGGDDRKIDSNAKRALLEWVQKRLTPYHIRVENFGAAWCDGTAFLALVHSFNPNLFDYRTIGPGRRRDNLELAFQMAQREFKVPALLDADDVLNHPDERSIMTYLSMFPSLVEGATQREAAIRALDEREQMLALKEAELERRLYEQALREQELTAKERALQDRQRAQEHERSLLEREKAAVAAAAAAPPPVPNRRAAPPPPSSASSSPAVLVTVQTQEAPTTAVAQPISIPPGAATARCGRCKTVVALVGNTRRCSQCNGYCF